MRALQLAEQKQSDEISDSDFSEDNVGDELHIRVPCSRDLSKTYRSLQLIDSFRFTGDVLLIDELFKTL